MINKNRLIENAKKAFDRADFEEAARLYELALGSTTSDLSPYYALAYIYENGLSSRGVDNTAALDCYSAVANAGLNTKASNLAHLGAARVIFRERQLSLSEVAVDHCQKAIAICDSSQARLLLGSIHEMWNERADAAREQYLAAFRMGEPLGLRFYARSKVKSKRYAAGFMAHVLTTIIAPFFWLRYGTRAPFG